MTFTLELPVGQKEMYGPNELSPQEARIVELVCQGLKNEDIGRAIGRSRLTVANHLRKIYDKLGCFNRVELALRATANKMARTL